MNRFQCDAGPAIAARRATEAAFAAAVERVQARLEDVRRRDRELDAHLDDMLAGPEVEPAAAQGTYSLWTIFHFDHNRVF